MQPFLKNWFSVQVNRYPLLGKLRFDHREMEFSCLEIRPTTAENNPDMRLLTRQTFRFSLDVLDRARRMSITRMSVTRKSISRMSITTMSVTRMSITTMSITTMSITTMSISLWPGPRRDLQIQQLAALCNNYRLAYILCRGGGGALSAMRWHGVY